MEAWLEWARGPFFWFALAFMILGLIRHIALTIYGVGLAVWRAGDKSLPISVIIKRTLQWLFPVSKIGDRWWYSITTILFHVSIIVAPLFLAGHLVLIRKGIGFAWPAIPYPLADTLTVIAIAAAIALVIERFAAADARYVSKFSDYALPVIIALPFITGVMLRHPATSLFAYQTTYFLHVVTANLVMILIPITKLNHCALMPTGQVVTEVAWKFPPDAGSKLAVALGKENEPI